jgi:PadR family transcriptional regulator, regulatory protein AphA
MELNPTSHVILGMLGLRPMCGYEIKALVDKSTRFFWAASYGQIYTELRRLAEAGLIAGEPDADSSRRRIEFRLTDAGRNELERWLAAPAQVQEMRDESLLKVFFSGAGGDGATRAALEAKAAHHRSLAAELRAIQGSKTEAELGGGMGTTLRFGIAFNDFVAEWCEREALAHDAGARAGVA